MKRRELLLLLGGTLAPTGSLRAQQKAMPVIGFLYGGTLAERAKQVAGFRDGLGESGYIEGKNVVIEYREAEGRYARLTELAADLVSRRVAVIAATTLPAALAARAASGTTPIVFLIGDDPVKHGLAASLHRPGGNTTGISMLGAGLNAKRLGLLRDLVPKGSRIAVLVNPNNPNVGTQSEGVEEASRNDGGQPVEVLKAGTEHDIETVFATLAERGFGGLIVGADPLFTTRRIQLVALAARYSVPAIYIWREFVEVGGLMSYGTSLTEAHRQVGIYTGKIVAGAKPADLPVLQPTTFELVINLKTANALGVTVPPILLVQADEVIE
jgi:putative tryptophan/tyrosine transport system substrate-binding protein